MKPEKKIMIAFLLNLAFSVFEGVGGFVTGSTAILSDAVHDLGDAVGIGISYGMEKRSGRPPDGKYTFGYARYSAVGSVITVGILLIGSISVIFKAVDRLICPGEVDAAGMMLFAVVGVCVNLLAAFFTRGSRSLNQKGITLHMLEDVLGWAAVLVGAVVIRWTGMVRIDPILSIGVAIFILVQALKTGKEALDVFLEKTPRGVDAAEICEHLNRVEGVREVHHIHIWSMDGQRHYATLHVVTDRESVWVKQRIREELKEHGIGHVTVELEYPDEVCPERECRVEEIEEKRGLHHHSH